MSEDTQLELFDQDYRDKDISSITRLFKDVKRYRNSSEFKKKLDFYASFPYLGVYNAALVEQQRPGARLVLTVKKWAELYNRKIKTNARPVIILMPFYPVEFLFDVSDTKPKDNRRKREENIIIEEIIKQHRASCKQEIWYYLDNLMDNLPKFGIRYEKAVYGSEIKAEIRVDTSEELQIKIRKDHFVKHHNYFTILDNRFYTKEVKEFEAETVSYLVCKRLGINTRSEEYLSYYMKENENIPDIDINCIFEAVDIIEKMITGNLDVTRCVMYKKDPAFKEKVKKELDLIKEEQSKAKAAKQSF